MTYRPNGNIAAFLARKTSVFNLTWKLFLRYYKNFIFRMAESIENRFFWFRCPKENETRIKKLPRIMRPGSFKVIFAAKMAIYAAAYPKTAINSSAILILRIFIA